VISSLTRLAPDERSCHAACGGKRRAKPLKQRTRSQVKHSLNRCAMSPWNKKSFRELVGNIGRMEEYLDTNGFALRPQSALSSDIAAARELLNLFESRNISQEYPHYEAITSLANASCLSAVVIGAAGKSFESQLKTKLEALKSGVPGPLMPGAQSKERDTVFEILCGYCCSQFSSDVSFDEPDVCLKYMGGSWALACKVAYGNPRTIANAVLTGIKQLGRIKPDVGIVMVQLTNIFPHKSMYEYDENNDQISTLHSEQAIRQQLSTLLKHTVQPIEKERMKLIEMHHPSRSSRVRAIIYLIHTVGYYQGHRTVMGTLYFQWLSNISTDAELRFASDFNSAWQDLAWPK